MDRLASVTSMAKPQAANSTMQNHYIFPIVSLKRAPVVSSTQDNPGVHTQGNSSVAKKN